MDFPTWLKYRGLATNTSTSISNRLERLASAYGDLRRHYDQDQLAQILRELTYGMEDERRSRPNPSRVRIKGDLRTGLASLKNAVTLYRSYLEGSQRLQAAEPRGPRTIRPKSTVADKPLNGSQILMSAYQTMGHNPVELVARSGVWAHPTIVSKLMITNPHAAWFPLTRRKRADEVRGAIVRGVKVDDNTYANQAIKLAAFGMRRVHGFHACHVWPGTCYDARYHTSIANLMLLPAAIAGLSDHDAKVASVLQYRAFELFGWKPEESPIPQRPYQYPTDDIWRPVPSPTKVIEQVLARRILGMPA